MYSKFTEQNIVYNLVHDSRLFMFYRKNIKEIEDDVRINDIEVKKV